ncbi:MAG: zinc ribbon domain-containing protein [Pseudobdellovibrionaceae bacterium]
MNQKCKSCSSCGMPMENQEDFALGNSKSEFCKYCTDENGQLLSFEKILQANAGYFKESQGLADQAALKMATDLLKAQPAWKNMVM